MTETSLIVLSGLEGNEPTHLSGFQLVLLHHFDTLHALWTVVFVCTLGFVIVRHVLMPLITPRRT